MSQRMILWVMGGAAALLYAWVGYFTFATLRPHLDCSIGPEIRFWGYRADVFFDCFNATPDGMITKYKAVLLGVDRALAVALAAFLALWSIRSRVWIGAVAALAYGLSDWLENAYLVKSLAGDASAIGVASMLTMSKFACLTLAFGANLSAVYRNRSAP